MPERWTDREIDGLGHKVDEHRRETKAGAARIDKALGEVRGEMKEGFARVDREMKDGFARVDREMKEGFARVDEEFRQVRGEMKEGFERVDTRLDGLHRTMVMGIVAMSGTIVVSIGIAAQL